MKARQRAPTFARDGYIVQSGFRIRKRSWGSGSAYSVDLGRRRENGKYTHERKQFRTLDEAKEFARDKRLERDQHGFSARSLGEKDRREAAEAIGVLTGTGASLVDAAKLYVRYHPPDSAEGLTLQQLSDLHIEAMKKRRLRKRTWKDAEEKLNRLCRDLGSATASAITTEILEDWLDAQGFSPLYRHNHTRCFRGLYSFGMKKHGLPANPAKAIEKPETDESTPEIISPAQVRAILERAEDDWPRAVPFLSIAFFAGVRPDELQTRRVEAEQYRNRPGETKDLARVPLKNRKYEIEQGLQWEDVNLETGYITVPASVAKTRRKRLVPIEDNLHQWLEINGAESGPVSPPATYMSNARRALRSVAGMDRWIQDVTRHCYATYHLNRDGGQIDKTALNLGHTGTRILFRHYNGVATPTASVEYFSIFPRRRAESGRVIEMRPASY